MKNYCIYLRKSRADAEAELRGEGETLVRHEKLLLEVAKRGNYNITKVYKELVSGETIAARPQMQKLLQEVERGIWDGVLVVEVERLARGDTIDQGIMAQAFKYSNTKIITPMKVYDPNNEFDEEYFEFGLFMSRREYKTINRRLQRGRAASAKEGKYVGNQPPYGYERIRIDGDKGFSLIPIEEQAKVVQLIYELYIYGERCQDGSDQKIGTTLIAKKLNKMKIPTKNNGIWTANTVRCILTNPVYTGKVRWNFRPSVKRIENGEIIKSRSMAKEGEYILVEGLHSPIISREIFELAQERLHSNANVPLHYDKPLKNPLSGIVFCAKCGHSMVRRPYGDRNKADTLLCKTIGCDTVSSELGIVEKRLFKGLYDWLKAYRLQWEKSELEPKPNAKIAVHEKTLQNLNISLTILNQQLEKTYDLLEQGVYDTDIFFSRRQLTTQKIREIKEQMQIVHQDIETECQRQKNMHDIIPQVEYVLQVYDTLSDAKAKNDLLKSILERVEYSKECSTRWHGFSDEFQIVLYPRVPKIEGK